MSDPFVAEIRIFAFNFAPTGWALCNGQLMPISQNTALFSLLGTNYGGDGKRTFALPDLQDNAPMQPGPGPGPQPARSSARCRGSEIVTLLDSEMPVHTHYAQRLRHRRDDRPTPPVDIRPRDCGTPARRPARSAPTAPPTPATRRWTSQALGLAGGSLPHNNMQPYLTLNFCIALQGIFPPRP